MSLRHVLAEVYVDARSGSLVLSPEALIAWHRDIFQSTFLADAGRIRSKDDQGWEHVSFGITIGTIRTQRDKALQGTHPQRIAERLHDAFERFETDVAEVRETPALGSATLACASLYARLLSIHPFVDGNLRAAYVCFQAALLHLDLIGVEFPDLAQHDHAIGVALRTDGQQSYGPLADLVASIIQEAQ